MVVHCTISILASTYGVPTHSGDGRNLENFQTQTQTGLGKVCTLERRSENGDNCFYEPECAPKCVDIGVKVRNSKDENIVCRNYTVSTKKLGSLFFAISQLLLGQIQKVRSVLKNAGSENFKTVFSFDIWPSRS